MKVAHWSKVTKKLADKYDLSWEKAKQVYKNLKSEAPRTPSLRMVTDLPAKLPRNLKGARITNPAKLERAAKPKNDEIKLPPNIALAPLKAPAVPRPIPTRQGARNKFEKALKDAGLPVAAIARNETGKQISAKWREGELQEKLAKLFQQGYKQIAKSGAMKEQTINRIEKVLMAFGITPNSLMWNNTLKQLYGISTK